MERLVQIGLPLTSTVGVELVVFAEQCTGGHPLAPQHGCGLTGRPIVATGRKLTSTVGSPERITPPAVFLSPRRITDFGTILSH
jgi:hypothetical protein